MPQRVGYHPLRSCRTHPPPIITPTFQVSIISGSAGIIATAQCDKAMIRRCVLRVSPATNISSRCDGATFISASRNVRPVTGRVEVFVGIAVAIVIDVVTLFGASGSPATTLHSANRNPRDILSYTRTHAAGLVYIAEDFINFAVTIVVSSVTSFVLCGCFGAKR